MPTGALREIYVAPERGGPVRRVARAEAVAGRGLVGDRYHDGTGSFSRWPGRGREVTLVDAAALADAAREWGVEVSAGEHRRNLVVSGVPLAALRGVPFQIGAVRFEGVRVCAPCKYLVRVTGQDAVFDALVGRGGLRAAVLSDGEVREGDAVSWASSDVARRPTLPG